jgi:hypothetical protein
MGVPPSAETSFSFIAEFATFDHVSYMMSVESRGSIKVLTVYLNRLGEYSLPPVLQFTTQFFFTSWAPCIRRPTTSICPLWEMRASFLRNT